MTTTAKPKAPKVQMLPVAKTGRGDNDRTVFQDAEIRDLAQSIQDNGLIQPITVRIVPNTNPQNGGDKLYEIVAGERRFRAISSLEWATFPGIVIEADDEQASAVMLAENTARANIDPIDEARAYDKRMQQFGWTAEEVAKKAGVSGSRVRARLKLLRLEDTVQKLTRSGQFPLSYAQLLVDADLPHAGQISAMRLFNSQPRPTLDWFQGIVCELEKCKQTQMFGEFELEMAIQQISGEFMTGDGKPDKKRLPRPARQDAPMIGSSMAEIVKNQILYWEEASKAWNSINSPFIAYEADAAAAALRGVLELVAG